jgi:hypothetical protein
MWFAWLWKRRAVRIFASQARVALDSKASGKIAAAGIVEYFESCTFLNHLARVWASSCMMLSLITANA